MSGGNYTQGNFQGAYNNNSGYSSGPSLSPTFRDNIFVTQQYIDSLKWIQRKPFRAITRLLGEKVNAPNKGNTYYGYGLARPSIGAYNQNITVGGTTFPAYLNTNSTTITTNKYLSRNTGGVSMIGIPFPMQTPNATRKTVQVDQFQGLAMVFDEIFLSQMTSSSLMADIKSLVGQTLDLDIEQYLYYAMLYSGPITEAASNYGALGAESIGITNRTNSALPSARDYSLINGASNLITPATIADIVNGAPVAGSMTGTSKNATFGNVPLLLGDAVSPLTESTLRQLDLYFAGANVTDEIAIVVDPYGYNQLKQITTFVNTDLSSKPDDYIKAKVNTDLSIYNFKVGVSNAIRPSGSNNSLYALAGPRGKAVQWIQGLDPEVFEDNRLDRAEKVVILCARQSYGAAAVTPHETAVVNYAPVA